MSIALLALLMHAPDQSQRLYLVCVARQSRLCQQCCIVNLFDIASDIK